LSEPVTVTFVEFAWLGLKV